MVTLLWYFRNFKWILHFVRFKDSSSLKKMIDLKYNYFIIIKICLDIDTQLKMISIHILRKFSVPENSIIILFVCTYFCTQIQYIQILNGKLNLLSFIIPKICMDAFVFKNLLEGLVYIVINRWTKEKKKKKKM